MKTRFAVVALLASLFTTVAFAAATEFDWVESQVLTRAAPSAIDDGIALFGTNNHGQIQFYRVTVCAQSGATLTGGFLDTYYMNPMSELWGTNPSLVMTVVSGQRCQTFPDIWVGVAGGRFLPAARAVTVSAGTTVTVTINAFSAR